MAPDQIGCIDTATAARVTESAVIKITKPHGGRWTCFRQPSNPNIIEIAWFTDDGQTVVDFVDLYQIVTAEVGWGLLTEAIDRMLKRYRDWKGRPPSP